MISCPSCGREQEGDYERCHYCGEAMLPREPSNKLYAYLREKKRLKIGGVLIAKVKNDGGVHVRQIPKAAWRPLILTFVLTAVAGALIPESLDDAWL